MDVAHEPALGGFLVLHAALEADALAVRAVRPRLLHLAAQLAALWLFLRNEAATAHRSTPLQVEPRSADSGAGEPLSDTVDQIGQGFGAVIRQLPEHRQAPSDREKCEERQAKQQSGEQAC